MRAIRAGAGVCALTVALAAQAHVERACAPVLEELNRAQAAQAEAFDAFLAAVTLYMVSAEGHLVGQDTLPPPNSTLLVTTMNAHTVAWEREREIQGRLLRCRSGEGGEVLPAADPPSAKPKPLRPPPATETRKPATVKI